MDRSFVSDRHVESNQEDSRWNEIDPRVNGANE